MGVDALGAGRADCIRPPLYPPPPPPPPAGLLPYVPGLLYGALLGLYEPFGAPYPLGLPCVPPE